MTENEKYLFDLQGYIAVENALDSSQITELNRILDEHIAAESEDNMSTQRFGGLDPRRAAMDRGGRAAHGVFQIQPASRIVGCGLF